MIRLNNVRLSHPHIKPLDEISLMRAREKTFEVSLKFEHWFLAKFANELGLDPVPLLIAYDAQKLLPSPEKIPPLTIAQTVQMWYKSVPDLTDWWHSLPCHEYFVDRVFPKTTPTERFVEPDFLHHWNEADANPIEDIRRWRQQVFEETTPIKHKVAVIKVDTDWSTIEARVLAMMDDRQIRGIILDFDSPGGEINPQMELYSLAGMMYSKPVAVPPEKRDTGYLKHDPSKRHKRRKRK